jgi:Na+/H+ antiporter NhaD/arsenite permease-like protein
MTPAVENVVAQGPDPATGQALWWAFALGADFGGNGTAVAAGANVVAIGIVVTVLSTMACVYVFLRYFR